MKKGVVLLILIVAVCLAQTQFTVLAGGTGRDEAESIIALDDGSYVLAGRTYTFGAGYRDVMIVKFTSEGIADWAKAYGGEYTDRSLSIFATSDGGFLVGGNTENFGMPYNGFFIMKLNSAGVIEWAKGVHTSYYEYGYCAIQTSDGGFLIAGRSSSHGAGGDDFYIVKLTSGGAFDWAKAIGGTSDDNISCVLQTSDGGLVLVGYTNSYGAGLNDIFVVKLNSSYAIEWAKAIGGTSDDFGTSIVQTSDGGYAISGYTDGYGAGSNDLTAMKLSSAGALEWAASLGGTDDDTGNDLVQADDGDLLITGYTSSYGIGEEDILLAKFSSEGAFEWANTTGGYGEDVGVSIVNTSDGGCAVGGEGYTGSTDFGLIKYDASGVNCMSSDFSPIIVDLTDSLTVASPSPTDEAVTPTILDIGDSVLVENVTLIDTMLCDNVGISENKHLPNDISIIAHPNPFNSAVAISTPANARVEIFDINGKHIAEIPGGNQIWQPEISISSGVYFVRAKIADREAISRIIYMK